MKRKRTMPITFRSSFVVAPGFPDASTTGVRSGVSLTTVNGNQFVTTSGTAGNPFIVSGLKVVGGNIVVQANHVVVEDCEVDGSGTGGSCVGQDSDYPSPGTYSDLTVRYCKLYARGGPAGQFDPYNQSAPAGAGPNATYYCNNGAWGGNGIEVHHCNIFGVENAFNNGDGYFHDNYIHDFAYWNWGADGTHNDGVQTFGWAGLGGLRIIHNTILAECTMGQGTPASPIVGSSCIALIIDQHDVTISNNLLSWGTATIYGNAQNSVGSSVNTVITNNRFSNKHGLGSPFSGLKQSDSGFVWSGNVVHETGAIVPGPTSWPN